MKKQAAVAILGLLGLAASPGSGYAQAPGGAPPAEAPPVQAAAADKLAMRLAMQPRQFSLRLTRSSKSTQNSGGTISESSGTYIQTYRVNTAGVYPDGSMALDVTAMGYAADMKGQDFTGAYDTSSGGMAPPMLKHWSAFPGCMYRVTVNPDGSVKNVEGLEAIQQKLLAAIDPAAGDGRPGIETELKRTFGLPGVKEQWEGYFAFYATTPIGIGEQWTRGRDILVGNLARSTSTQYTLKERRQGYALIEFTTTATPLQAPPEIDGFAGLKLSPAFSGSARGQITMHEQTGWPYRVTSQEHVEGALKVLNGSRGIPAEYLITLDASNMMETGP